MSDNSHFIKWFNKLYKEDSLLVGQKAANLGDIYNNSFPVPNGFVITKNSLYHFLKENKLDLKIKHIISTVNFNDLRSISQVSNIIKNMIISAKFPDDLVKEILDSYKKLGEPLISIKFSEHITNYSQTHFTSRPQAILNIKGDAVLIEKIKQFWASLFNSKEIFYRHSFNIDQTQLETSLIIQQMIESDMSGIIYTTSPVSIDKNMIVIKAALGLGEYFSVFDQTDTYEVNKTDFKIEKKLIAYQKVKFIKVNTEDKEVDLNKKEGSKQKIYDNEIIELAKLGSKIEKTYFFPQKVEWAIKDKSLYIIQTSPLNEQEIINPINIASDVLIKGISASKGIASGPVKIITSIKELENVEPKDIVVLKEIKSSFLPIFKKVSAVILENFDANMQILFTSNDLRLPCIIDAKNATSILRNGQIVTVNSTKGEIYKGGFSINPNKYKDLPTESKTATKIYANIVNDEQLNDPSIKNTEGLLLLGSGSIITNLGVHPHLLLKENKQNLLSESIFNYLKLAIEKADKKVVMYQLSNLTSADYRKMNGGFEFEQTEENPNIGFRGSFRHIHDKKSFNIELEGIKKAVSYNPGQTINLVIPYVRSTEELKLIKNLISDEGLIRSNSLKLFVSIDIPSNVLILDDFIEQGVDGFFINSYQLLSLLTGTDANNPEIIAEVNKYNHFLKQNIESIIKTANKHKLTTVLYNGILSNSENLIPELINLGLGGLAVEIDLINQTKKTLLVAEKKFINNING